MFALFCLRLAFGLIACLVLLPAEVNPRFFRTHFLTTLGLLAGTAVFAIGQGDLWFWLLLGCAILLAFAASISWHIEGNPGGRALIWLSVPVLAAALFLLGRIQQPANLWFVADDFSSAGLLGAALTAMLMGHLYLIAPSMSLTPLYRLITVFALAVLVRLAVAAGGLWLWTIHQTGTLETETLLWLGVRWVVGIIGPLVLGWMAWETARIRSTQSATGILYVAVILVFLGELTSLLLAQTTNWVL